uniref:Cupiennin 14a n=2 Tax=Cupiennius salei TaxID=6928 RepID=A0A8D7ZR47_CUPSA|nr:Cupiennin 14a precursor [Cupiennius salei]
MSYIVLAYILLLTLTCSATSSNHELEREQQVQQRKELKIEDEVYDKLEAEIARLVTSEDEMQRSIFRVFSKALNKTKRRWRIRWLRGSKKVAHFNKAS